MGLDLRIDPLGKNSANGKYGIPANNPFAREKIPGIVKRSMLMVSGIPTG